MRDLGIRVGGRIAGIDHPLPIVLLAFGRTFTIHDPSRFADAELARTGAWSADRTANAVRVGGKKFGRVVRPPPLVLNAPAEVSIRNADATGFPAVAAACEATGLVPIGIDGKSVRGTKKATATGCLHLVSAWACDNRLTLGQVSVPDGSNEIAAIPELLRMLELKGRS